MTDFAAIARKLGPERCASALAAYDDPDPVQAALSWEHCVLGRCLGAPGSLVAAAREWEVTHHVILAEMPERVADFWRDVMGLTSEDVYAVSAAFGEGGQIEWVIPAQPKGSRELLRLALEAEAAKASPVPCPA